MALTIGKVNAENRNHVIGNRREVVVDVTCDNSYTVGGYALTPANLGVDWAFDFIEAGQATTGHTAAYDYVNNKLMVFLAGTQITASVDLHTVVFRVVAHGKGNGFN